MSKFPGLAVSNWQDLWMNELIHCQQGILGDMVKMVVSQGRLQSYGEEFDNILAYMGSALIDSIWEFICDLGKALHNPEVSDVVYDHKLATII